MAEGQVRPLMADRPDRPARAALESGQGEGAAGDGGDAGDEEDRDRRAGAGRGSRLESVAKLIYAAIASLDDYVADKDGKFDWAAPDEEVHTFVNDLERPIGTYLYGRRMYEVMSYWETALTRADQPPFIQDYAEIWQSADKV